MAAGDYYLRPEIIALHEGNRQGGTQLYMECVHIKVTGSGTAVLPAGVSFPGAYKATDAGILFDIYSGFSSYTIPGPKLWNGASSGAAPATPVTTKAPATPTKAAGSAAPAKTTLLTSAKPLATAVVGAVIQKYAQCGGQGYTGAQACAADTKCTVQNAYYSQCV